MWLILHFADFNNDVETFCPTAQQKKEAFFVTECIETLEKNGKKDKSIKNCIEITENQKRSKTCKQLLHLVRNHYHVSSEKALINNIPQAILRAKKLGECDPNSNNYPENICTNVYKFYKSKFYRSVFQT